jgi:hypothetical protein
MRSLGLSLSEIYDFAPDVTHSAGDIWRGLPTFGLTPNKTCTGIIISPSCDLANEKTETISYLPIAPLRNIICGPPFHRNSLIQLREALNTADLVDEARSIQDKAMGFSVQDVNQLIARVAKMDQKDKKVLRVVDCLRNAEIILQNDAARFPEICKSREYAKIVEGLVKNAVRSDMHFLPADGLRDPRSLLKVPSCAMLRYPITIPVHVLDLANDVLIKDWESAMKALAAEYHLADEFKEQPLKMLKLRSEFLSDLISRYLALFLRLGSRDFSDQQVANFVSAA